MSKKTKFLDRFSGKASEEPLYVPDLTLWYEWHASHGTLPKAWQDYDLFQIAQALKVPAWLVARPWRVETPGVKVSTIEKDGERIVQSETSLGTLTARWTLGPNGDWWQVEYPVKSANDLLAVLELVNARSYVMDRDQLTQLQSAGTGENGPLVAIELPRRPYSDLLHELLGWSEGLLLLGEPAVQEILVILEAKLHRLVEELARLPGEIVLSPDNLDGQFISPKAFQEYLAESYGRSAEILHRQDKFLLVHIGGPVRHLLPLLAASGVDGLEGIASAPQSDVSLTEARDIVGPELTLWGGIPQDYLLPTYDDASFKTAVQDTIQAVEGDSRMIIGVADRVPVAAEWNRIGTIQDLVAHRV
jgi:hypothetical protein